MKAICIALAALALSQVVAGQTQPYSSTLFQTYNATSDQIGFLQCNQSDPIVVTYAENTTSEGTPLVPLKAAAAGLVTVDAVWFGGEIGPASNFMVVGNCSVLQLTSNGGHGTTVYTGPVPLAPNGCSVNWYQSTNYLHVFVAITNTGFGWSVSLPTITSVRAQTSCNGGYQYCPLATGVSCDSVLSLPSVLNADGSFAPDASPAAAPAEEAMEPSMAEAMEPSADEAMEPSDATGMPIMATPVNEPTSTLG